MTGHKCLVPGACVTCSRPKEGAPRGFRRRPAACACKACATNRLHAALARPNNSTAVALARQAVADARLRKPEHTGPEPLRQTRARHAHEWLDMGDGTDACILGFRGVPCPATRAHV